MRLLLALSVLFVGVGVSADTNYRPFLLGNWQCHSAVVTQFGESSTLGSLVVHDSGELEGNGNLLLSYPGIEKELPLAATLKAKWTFENNQIFVTDITGDIISPYPLLNGIANAFKEDIRQSPTTVLRLTKVGQFFMALTAVDNTEIQCVRPKAD